MQQVVSNINSKKLTKTSNLRTSLVVVERMISKLHSIYRNIRIKTTENVYKMKKKTYLKLQ